jgi:hypothetical protein
MPLLFHTMKLYNHRDPLVRTSVRSALMNIIEVGKEAVALYL